jgi:putative endonuclease
MANASAQSRIGWYTNTQAAPPRRTLPVVSLSVRSHVSYRQRFYRTTGKLNGMPSYKTGAAYVYVLHCRDGSLYTGWTDDLERRLDAHAGGKASKYTRSRLPVRLAAWFALETASSARSLEARFKRLTRRQKLAALKSRQAFGFAMHKAPGL